MLAGLARLCLRVVGWRTIGERPQVNKMIVIAFPHTSNWDLPLYVLTAWVFGIPLAWMGKDALFRGPLGVLMRALGGIAIFRDRRENVVQQMASRFAEEEELCLVIAIEGTRSYVDYVKSGFYQIALAAQVPLCTGFLDYERKEAGVGPLVYPTGDADEDMRALREFYAGKVARYPEQMGRIHLRDAEKEQNRA